MSDKQIKEVTDIPGVGPATAEKLSEAGYDDLLSIAAAAIGEIMDASGLSEAKARKIVQTARDNLNLGFITVDEVKDESFTISTGSKAFDELLGGGIKSGGITEVYGAWGSGKSQLSHQVTVEAIKQFPDSKVVFIDTENTFSIKRISEISEHLGLDPNVVLKKINLGKAYNNDHQMLLAEEVEKMIKKGDDIKLIVVDSLMALFRVEMQARGKLAERQQKINRHMRVLSKMSDLYNVVVLVTNQVSANPGLMYGNPNQAIGGNIVAHNARTRIELRRKQDNRIAKLVDSNELADGEVVYRVTEDGVVDVK